MFRAIRNIILLMVICFIASGIPLYAYTIDFNMSVGTTSQNNLTMDVQLDQDNGPQRNITVLLSTDGNPINIAFDSDNPLTIDLYHDDLHIKKLNPNQISITSPDSSTTPISVTQENPMTIDFSIRQDELDIPDGDYRLMIKPNISNLEESIPTFNIAINFASEYQYIPSLNSINNKQTALNLYFPDPQFSRLIPITRIIPYTNTPLRYTLNNLEEGPSAEFGLPLGSPIPSNAKLGLKNRIAGVYLPADIGGYAANSAQASIALGSFINSLTAIDVVDAVQFYFGNKIEKIGFHDREVDKPFYPYEQAEIYVGTLTETNRILLTPIPLYEDQSRVESIFEMLKYSGKKDFYRYDLQPPLPDTVQLVSYDLQDGILTLNLSEGFLMVYPEEDHKKAFMLEAMVYSFTSLPEVEGVIFQVEGESLSSFGGLELSTPTYPSKYINPEK